MASGITVTTNFQNYLNAITDLGKVYIRQEFTGGTSDALDSIAGTNLETGVSGFVLKDNLCYMYKYIKGATDPENPPYVIAPDTDPDGRWFLYSVSDADRLDGYHASQTPSANTIPVLNSAGQLQLPFSQTPILVRGQAFSDRTFYVDAINGDDNNDGSASAPFKTIKKACDCVPTGGYGNLIVKGGDYHITANISLVNKVISLTQSTGENVNIIFDPYEFGDSYYTYHRINLINSYLAFIHPYNDDDGSLNLRFASYAGTNTPSYLCGIMIGGLGNYRNLSGLYLRETNVDVSNNSDLSLIKFDAVGSVALSAYLVNITTASAGYFVSLTPAACAFVSLLSYTIDDSDHLVAGVVKDANGVPRNVVSNIVF